MKRVSQLESSAIKFDDLYFTHKEVGFTFFDDRLIFHVIRLNVAGDVELIGKEIYSQIDPITGDFVYFLFFVHIALNKCC